MNTLKISINKITVFLVIFKKIGKCNCMRFFLSGKIHVAFNRNILSLLYNSFEMQTFEIPLLKIVCLFCFFPLCAF